MQNHTQGETYYLHARTQGVDSCLQAWQETLFYEDELLQWIESGRKPLQALNLQEQAAEIESADARTNQEYRECYEEENKLLKVNTEELMKLNDNIHDMRTGLEQLANAVQHYEYKIASKTLKQTENLGNGLISKLSNELDVQYSKFEARMKEQKDEDRIRVPTRVFYITVICLVSLFCFFICTVATNIHLLNSGLLWKIFGWNVGITIVSIALIIGVPQILEQSK